jgi:hypothetical protein
MHEEKFLTPSNNTGVPGFPLAMSSDAMNQSQLKQFSAIPLRLIVVSQLHKFLWDVNPS